MKRDQAAYRFPAPFLVLAMAFAWAWRTAATAGEGMLKAPSGLMCELMAQPQLTQICDRQPEFGWVVDSSVQGDMQTAYQVLVSSGRESLARDQGDFWDSGKIASACSANIEYHGLPLSPNAAYFWKVRVWNKSGEASPYSAAREFRTGILKETHETSRYPLVMTRIEPVRLLQKAEGHYFIDFGKAAFGTIELTLTSPTLGREVEVHLGEVPDGDRERIPYEADAYINQLCHYCVDREYTMARHTHEYLITHPTWPTEWILHSVLMAWADYLYTGNTESITHFYDDLKAWDNKYKPNQDWNHAWGAAPANIIPRYLMGVQPIEPGFAKVRIMPRPASLKSASLDLPTIRGTIHVDFSSEQGRSFLLNITLPANVKAMVCLPRQGDSRPDVWMDGRMVEGTLFGEFVVFDDVGSGKHRFERRL